MRDFRDLQVWEKAHQLSLELYRATQAFPAEERFGLTAQMRRAAVSIGSNISEGAGRGSSSDFARFLQIAFGSAAELEYQVILSCDLDFLAPTAAKDLTERLQEIKRMLSSLIKRLTSES